MQARACNFIKKQTLAQVFSRQFCEISKNSFFPEHLQATVFESWRIFTKNLKKKVFLKKTLVNCVYIELLLFSKSLMHSCLYEGCVIYDLDFTKLYERMIVCLNFLKIHGLGPNYADIFHKIFRSHFHTFLNYISDYTTAW